MAYKLIYIYIYICVCVQHDTYGMYDEAVAEILFTVVISVRGL